MGESNDERIEMESQPLNTEKKIEVMRSNGKSNEKEKPLPLGLTKEELMKYANDPFWCKLRKVLFATFWLLWLSMFVGAFLIIHYVPNCPANSRLRWHQKSAVAQVDYDLFYNNFSYLNQEISLISSLLKLQTLILPDIFDVDSQNNVTNFFKLNPKYGDTQKLTKTIKDVKQKNNFNIVFELNALVTSRNHTWFESFLKQETSFKDYYLKFDKFKQKLPDGYSYENHQNITFVKKNQLPVLNLNNANVRDEFEKIFQFWGQKGIKGFRFLNLPYLLQNNNELSVDSILNQNLIRDWNNKLHRFVSDGVIMVQLEDDETKNAIDYLGTQDKPAADMFVNKLFTKYNNENFNGYEIANKLKNYSNSLSVWDDKNSNIGPWTGWLTSEKKVTSKVNENCFFSVLGNLAPRGTPISTLSYDLLNIQVPIAFFDEMKRIHNGEVANVKVTIFSTLKKIREEYIDEIAFGKLDFPLLDEKLFTMTRYSDKRGLIIISNFELNPRTLKLNTSYLPNELEVIPMCEDDKTVVKKINLNSFVLNGYSTILAKFNVNSSN